MRFLRLMLAATALLAFTATSQAAEPGYTTLAQPVRTDSGKKVEVIEFFMYTCPHCNALDPMLTEWVKKQGDKITFRRLHFPAGGEKDPLAHAYITLEAMGQVEQFHSKIFNAIHVQRDRMYRSDEQITDFLVKNGMDKAKYQQFFNSFAVLTKLKRLGPTIGAYKIDTAPTLVVDGRFVTSPSLAGAPGMPELQAGKQTLAVLDQLVAKAAAEKK
ncbi:thiol:disulfide interchange protein DsbA/DsbL [Pseudoduganella armeniaca]|uniref:Thiol:disulfide interchange protein n=1 Tax=Pseudoduganella armeniaca TaxID=2072590 RepID=A0A2R4C8I2_9BURK|nr:thiol:disulfide interchange protein DsbA/DsbL [Pseudoduganella armeniaca]AVR95927.1 disulfide bond formation protein DsbA [Pseudoduganella armeniaca]